MTRRLLLALLLGAGVVACDDPAPPTSSFYEERIQPIVEVGCVQQTTGCHLADDEGRAAGNLDMSSFDALMRRADALPAYGPYPTGLLLLKGGEGAEIPVETWDADNGYLATVQTDVRHNAGSGLALDSRGYAELKRWIESGFRRTGVVDDEPVRNQGACVNGVGHAPDFDPAAPPADDGLFEAFRRDVMPVLSSSCSGSTCHGSTIADLFLTCGDSPEELRWNFYTALSHVTTPVSLSPLLRRPLAQVRGGTFHEGGNVFTSPEDPAYQVLFAWAERVVTEREDLVRGRTDDPGLAFFANRVQPVLVRKGCMFLGCHAPAMFHDLRLRGGSQGVFSRIATYKNYEMSLHQLALGSPDPNDSRLIAKNLFPAEDVPGGQGIAHRGGSLLEDFGASGATFDLATPDDCDGYDVDEGDLNEVPGYCILARWHEIEREKRIATGELFDPAEPMSLVWVARPPGTGDVRDFDTFRGGADLRSAPLDIAADGTVSLGPSASLLAGCGVAAGADVRQPAVSWDGTRVAFAARESAGQPLRLYWMEADGAGCERVPGVAAAMDSENGILTHDFDPAFAPDGRLVFASTRGNLDRGAFPYAGPTRTPAAMQPNANLYVLEDGAVRQLTFLLDQEVAPSFMADGRVIFTTEKRAPELHQLALRRQNLDGGDYHPLFAQRGSVGFSAATEVLELPNRNLAFIAAPLGADDGAGTLVIANRSIGPDQDDRDPGDRFYIHSMRLPAPGAFGNIPGIPAGPRRTGVFRSPALLPVGKVVVSCALDAADLASGPYAFDLCVVDPNTESVTRLGGESGMANVEAAAVFARPDHGVFASRVDEANAHTEVVPGERDAVIHVSDFPMLATLVFSNTREGRPIDPDIGGFDVLEALPPPPTATSFADVASQLVSDDFGQVFVRYEQRGHVNLRADGSAKFRIDGGMAMVLRATTAGGTPLEFGADAPFTGEVIQREQMQFYPGERSNQSMQRRFFNGLCGGCHGSISGRELDARVDVDILTSASRTLSVDESPTDARR